MSDFLDKFFHRNQPMPRRDMPSQSDIEEAVLMQRAQSGNFGAFLELRKRHQRGILALCTRMMGSSEKGEAAAIEAFEQVYLKREQYRYPNPPACWMYKIAANHSRGLIRNEVRHGKAGPLDPNIVGDDGIPADVEWKLHWQYITDRAKQMLTDEQWLICRLRYQQEMTSREIAETLGKNDSTIRGIIHTKIKPFMQGM